MEEEKANPANLDTSKLNRKKPEHFKSTIYWEKEPWRPTPTV
jgi:hypothetical protein